MLSVGQQKNPPNAGKSSVENSIKKRLMKKIGGNEPYSDVACDLYPGGHKNIDPSIKDTARILKGICTKLDKFIPEVAKKKVHP